MSFTSSMGRRKLLVASVAALVLAATGAVLVVWRGLSPPRMARAASLSASTDGAVLPPIDYSVTISWMPRTVTRFEAAFVAAARAHQVDPEMLAIVTLVESGGWSGAESPSGAMGLMQVMPATGAGIGEDRGMVGHETRKLSDPAYNIDFGAWFFARMLECFRTDDVERSIALAASAYNGGPTRLERHLQGEAELSEQTKRYRYWVGGMWRERREARSAVFEEWMAAGGARLVGLAFLEMGESNTKP